MGPRLVSVVPYKAFNYKHGGHCLRCHVMHSPKIKRLSYHMLKRGNLQYIERAQQTGNFELVHGKLRDLVRYYAVEHGLHASRLCNVPQFDANSTSWKGW